MKTLADFKRALIPGTKWELIGGRGIHGIRTVISRSSTDICFQLIDNKLSFLTLPKARDIKFTEKDEVEIYSQGIHQNVPHLLAKYRQVG